MRRFGVIQEFKYAIVALKVKRIFGVTPYRRIVGLYGSTSERRRMGLTGNSGMFVRTAMLALAVVLGINGTVVGAPQAVTLNEDPIVIPTYPLGAPDPDPIFYTQESYQGAQKHVYPYP